MADKMEILSPAGDFETLKVAIANGADAVYIGGRNFSARKNAVNFSDEEIEAAVKYVHLHCARLYVTFNTLVHDSEMEEAFRFAEFLYKTGADALIVQDLGLVHMLRKFFPDFEIHASTQMTLHSLDGVKAAQTLGFKRVVLSRELSFDEIKTISDNTDAELEVFVHGALCMSYSGQCLMSSFLGCRSGNRGACAQPCRLPYTLSDSRGNVLCKGKYPLSLKDLCLVDEMNVLSECKAASLKIEGRMKSAEYVCVVTSMYDKYRNGGKVSQKDMDILKNIFSRSGFTKGYLHRNYGREMLNYDKNNDNVYTSINKAVLDFAEELMRRQPPKIKAAAQVEIRLGQPVKAVFSSKGDEVRAEGAVAAQKAINTPLNEERIRAQILKTGNTPFEIENLTIAADEGISLPIKEINTIRRRGLELLEEKLSYSGRSTEAEYIPEPTVKSETGEVKYSAEVITLAQAEAALSAGFDKVIVPYVLYDCHRDYFNSIKDAVSVILPSIDRADSDMAVDVDEVYVSNISQFKKYSGRKIVANYTLNIFNSLSLRTLKKLGAKSACLSPELNLGQIRAIDDYLEKELVVYGRIPLMTVQNCVVRSANGKCACSGAVYYLTDRKGAKFPLVTDKSRCINTVYNCKPVYMADKLDEIPPGGVQSYRFIFTVETEAEIAEIYNNYKNKEKTTRDFTRGHFYRGV